MAEISVEAPRGLPQTSNSNEVARDIRFKQLTEKYGLQSGVEISLKKINIDPKYHSDIKTGGELKGSIKGDIRLGRPLVLYDNGNFIGNTSGLVNIREIDDKLQILTESHSTYELIVKKPKISVEDKFKKLTEKYGIHKGLEISINKVSIDPNNYSKVKLGTTMSGIISGEIGIGKPLILFNGRTSDIVDIEEKDEKIRFKTASNSVYEVIPKKNKIEEKIEKNIKKQFDKQPETTKDILNNHQELFVTTKEIDNKIWFFTANYGDNVMALVNSDEEPEIFHPRFFRVSGSDHQFKAYPGYRSDGHSATKGDEDDKNHHYVQSAKLDSRVILALQELPKENDYKKRKLISDFMPVMADLDKNIVGKNLEDFKFSEEQISFKNEGWQKIKDYQKYFLNVYGYLNHHVGKMNAKKFYTSLESVNVFFKFDIKKLSETMEAIPNKDDNWTMADIMSNKDPLVINFKNEISQVAQNFTEAIFTHEPFYNYMEKVDFIPDFNQEPVKRYIKTDDINKIKIEVFENKSPEGDTLCWEMATDNKGRTYVDNIYDPTVGIDNYGTPKKKTNMGMLIYKPEDYDTQVAFVPKKYTKELDDYVDISRLIELSKPVRMYKESLTSR